MPTGRASSIWRASNGRYRKIRRLAVGGTANVELVERVADQTVHVAKCYRLATTPDWKGWELFERGARVLQSLDHPGIPRFGELIRLDGERDVGLWLVEEFIAGKNLTELVAATGPLSVPKAAHLARGVLSVLDYLHGRLPPVVHRDVKPSNVIVTPEGAVYLVDFGAVQQAIRACTMGGSTVVGTFGYMPPEQYMGRAEPASDLYALGVTLLFVLTGREPSDFPIRDLTPQFQDALPGRPRLVALLQRLIDPRIESRLPTARAAAQALRSLEHPAPAPAPGAPDATELPSSLAAFLEAAAPGEDFQVLSAADAAATTRGGGECPGCGAPLHVVQIGPRHTEVDICRACEGLWLDSGELDDLITRPLIARPNLAAIRRAVRQMRAVPEQTVVYRKCPRCRAIMTRANFGRVSGVILDECGKHGIWLDAGELATLREFVRVGGMELALEHRMQQHRDAVQHARHRTMLETLQARRGGNDWRDF